MKLKCSKILILTILLFSYLVAGCKTSQEVVAYKSLASLVIAVDNAKLAYYDYREHNVVSQQQDSQVKKLYESYQRMMKLVELTYYTTKKAGIDPQLIKVAEDFMKAVKDLLARNPNLSLRQLYNSNVMTAAR